LLRAFRYLPLAQLGIDSAQSNSAWLLSTLALSGTVLPLVEAAAPDRAAGAATRKSANVASANDASADASEVVALTSQQQQLSSRESRRHPTHRAWVLATASLALLSRVASSWQGELALLRSHQELRVAPTASVGISRLAYSLYESAHDQGATECLIPMGDMQFDGRLDSMRKPNYAAAVRLYEQARDKTQDAQASFNLGYMLEMGLGKRRNVARARESYNAARARSKDALVPVKFALMKLDFLEWWGKSWLRKVTRNLRRKKPRRSAGGGGGAGVLVAGAVEGAGGAVLSAQDSAAAAAATVSLGHSATAPPPRAVPLATTDGLGHPLTEGSVVTARWRGGSAPFPGYVHTVHLDGTMDVQYDDGDFELEVPRERVSKVEGKEPIRIERMSFTTTDTKGHTKRPASVTDKEAQNLEARTRFLDKRNKRNAGKLKKEKEVKEEDDDGVLASSLDPENVLLVALIVVLAWVLATMQTRGLSVWAYLSAVSFTMVILAWWWLYEDIELPSSN
jgi:hypothetical protein